jgi:hypothetical protein
VLLYLISLLLVLQSSIVLIVDYYVHGCPCLPFAPTVISANVAATTKKKHKIAMPMVTCALPQRFEPGELAQGTGLIFPWTADPWDGWPHKCWASRSACISGTTESERGAESHIILTTTIKEHGLLHVCYSICMHSWHDRK